MKTQPIPHRRARLLAAFATASMLAVTAAQAQTNHTIHIPAGALDTALLALAAQSHDQLLYAPGLVSGRKASSLDGAFTTEVALHRLLAGTDIVVQKTGASSFALRRAPAADAPITATPAATRSQESGPFADRPIATLATASADPAPQPALVSEVEVTGTHIRGAPSASPLLVISSVDLERSGQSTLAAALQALPQNFVGGASEGNTNTGGDRVSRNANYSTALNLRGLGNNATLVLINGRRMAGSGAFGDFSDLSLIPTSAVARVEVLLDGASAIYGSDAVGGVVNIILRRDVRGGETRLEGGLATEGRPREFQISQLLGRRWDGGGVTFSYEHQERGALPGADRGFAANADLRPLGGSDQRQIFSFPGNILVGATPAFAIPAGQNGVGLLTSNLLAGVVNKQNQRLGQDLLPRQRLDALYVSGDQSLGDRLDLSGDVRLSRRVFGIHLSDPTATLTVNHANPFFVSPTGGASDTIDYSFAGDLPNSLQTGSVETLGVSLGGVYRLFADWRAEGYLTSGRDKEDNRTSGLLNSSNLSEALGALADNPLTPFSTSRDSFFNPFTGTPGSNLPGVLAFVGSGFSLNHIVSHVYSANLQADGSLLALPGGRLQVAFGVQARRETLQINGTNYIATVAPAPQSTTNDARRVVAGFAELRAPLVGPDNAVTGVQRLELSVAGRIEHYSDVGSTSNPKVGLLWQPVDGVQVRATYGTSFRAPALREAHDTAVNAPLSLASGATRVQSLLLIGGNPTLNPETATSWTAGIDLHPSRWPGLAASLTWYDVTYRNRIDKPVQQNLVGALTDASLASFVTRISPSTSAADLALITGLLASPATTTANGVFPPTAFGAIVDDRYVNTATLHVQGLDWTGSYLIDLGADRLSFGLNATYTLRYDQAVTPTSPTVGLAGVAGFPVRFRGRLTSDWTRDRLTAGVAFNYVSSYRDTLGVGIADQPTFDLQFRLAPASSGTLRGIAATLNVRNVFDRKPPFYNNVFGVGYDPTNADPIGRFLSLQLVRAW